MLTTKHT